MDKKSKRSTPCNRNFIMGVLVSLGLFYIILYQSTSTTLRDLSYDEVNYLLAARQPLIETWSSFNTLSILDFIRLSLDKIGYSTYTSGTLIEEEYDGFYLRNLHGPLFLYPVSLIVNLDLGPDFLIWIARIIYFFFFVCSISIYICLKESQKDRALIQIILCSSLILLTPGLLEAGQSLNVHLVLTFLTLFSMLVVEKIVRSPSRHLTVVTLGALCALLTITTVTALIVIIGFYIYIFLAVGKETFNKIILTSILGFIGALLVVNPGFFLSYDIIKSAFTYLYRIIFIQSEYTQLNIGVNAFIMTYLPLFFAFLIIVGYKIISLATYRVTAAHIDSGPIRYFKSLEFMLFIVYGIFIVPFLVNWTYFLLPSVLLLLLTTRQLSVLITTHFKESHVTLLLVFSLALLGVRFSAGFNWDHKTQNFAESLSEKSEAFGKINSLCESQRVSGLKVFSFDHNEVRLRSKSCASIIPLIVDYDGKTLLYRSGRKWHDFQNSYGQSASIIIIKSTRIRELVAVSNIKNFSMREISNHWLLGTM